MRPLLRQIGVPEGQIGVIPKEYKIHTLATAFDWLHDIYLSHEYAEAKMIFKSVPQETWDNYKLLGVEDLTEQRLLEEVGKKLSKLWKTKRPRLFKTWNRELCERCNAIAKFEYKGGYKQCGECKEVFDGSTD